jgi:2,5-dihydroxypyridine 5,6-dioxygenase
MVVDCTVEGLLQRPSCRRSWAGGVLMISNEHPEAPERLVPTADLEAKVKAEFAGCAGRTDARHVSGTDSPFRSDGAAVGGWGIDAPGTISHWPEGCAAFRRAASTGVVLAGDEPDFQALPGATMVLTVRTTTWSTLPGSTSTPS